MSQKALKTFSITLIIVIIAIGILLVIANILSSTNYGKKNLKYAKTRKTADCKAQIIK